MDGGDGGGEQAGCGNKCFGAVATRRLVKTCRDETGVEDETALEDKTPVSDMTGIEDETGGQDKSPECDAQTLVAPVCLTTQAAVLCPGFSCLLCAGLCEGVSFYVILDNMSFP